MTEEKLFYSKFAQERFRLNDKEAVQFAEAVMEIKNRILAGQPEEKILSYSEKFLEDFSAHFTALVQKHKEKQNQETRRQKKKQQLDIFEK